MARIEHLHGDTTHDPSIVVDTLRPESASDAHEIASWVQHILQAIHKQVCWIDLELCTQNNSPFSLQYHPHSPETYKQLVRQWIFWAASNNVPFFNLQNLPDSGISDLKKHEMHATLPCTQRYITMARIEQLHGDAAEDRDVVIDALRPEASDADETTEWVKNLLWHIRGKVRQINLAPSLPILRLCFLPGSTIPTSSRSISAS